MVLPDPIDQTNVELWGIYNVLRSSYLNLLYYGRKASRLSDWNLWLQLIASVGSLGAVGTFIAVGAGLTPQHPGLSKAAAAAIGLLSAVCAAIPPTSGMAGRISQYERLHFCYSELFQIAQRMTMEVRREGIATPDIIGGAKLLQDFYSRLGQSDEPGIDVELRNQCENEVRQKYPEGSLWYAGVDGNQETSPTPTKA